MTSILNRFRGHFKRIIRPIALAISKTNIDPNLVTLSGLITSILIPLLTLYYSYTGYLLGIIISSFLDVLDGEIARISNKTSKFGAFLDSTCDRVSDAIYIYSLTLLNLDTTIALILIILSFMISYARARAEGLGLKIEGTGLMERGERVIYIFLMVLVSIFYREFMLIGSYIMLILLLYTLAERILYVRESLRDKN
ncbi:MAG: archaetidylinositol phosphate synthase [Sulfolobales archaeon]